jgi:hypothetical protein
MAHHLHITAAKTLRRSTASAFGTLASASTLQPTSFSRGTLYESGVPTFWGAGIHARFCEKEFYIFFKGVSADKKSYSFSFLESPLLTEKKE